MSGGNARAKRRFATTSLAATIASFIARARGQGGTKPPRIGFSIAQSGGLTAGGNRPAGRGHVGGGRQRRRAKRLFRRVVMNDNVRIIEGLEDERYRAIIGKDLGALDRVLHGDLLLMHSSGVADSKASYIAGIRDGVWDYKSVERGEQTVKALESIGLVFNRLAIDIAIRGAPKQLDVRTLSVWVAAKGEWRLIAMQSGPVPTPTP
jgi:Domain of unknown function (DUF4440)